MNRIVLLLLCFPDTQSLLSPALISLLLQSEEMGTEIGCPLLQCNEKYSLAVTKVVNLYC